MKKIIKMTIAIVLVVSMAFVTFGAQEYNLSNEIENVQLVTQYDDVDVDKMDTVLFGSYPQNDETGKTKEPIEWIVLERDKINRKALLLSKYILDAKCYDDRCYDTRYLNTNLAKGEYSYDEYKEVTGYDLKHKNYHTQPLFDLYIHLSNNDKEIINSYVEHKFLSNDDINSIKDLLKDYYFDWDTCTLKKWLNSDFLNSAFNSDEKNKILETEYGYAKGKEYIFLLDDTQVENYFPRQTDSLSKLSNFSVSYKRLTKATNYAKNIKNFDENLYIYGKNVVDSVFMKGYDFLMNTIGGDSNSDRGTGCSDYWLTTYDCSDKTNYIRVPDGAIDECDYSKTSGVRPAIWISY